MGNRSSFTSTKGDDGSGSAGSFLSLKTIRANKKKNKNQRSLPTIKADRADDFGPALVAANKFPLQGVRLSYLRSLKVDDPKMTIYEICKALVLPATLKDRCSYANLLSRTDPEQVKDKADVFVSYAWMYTWEQLMECLGKLDNSYVWLDVFVVNQHLAGDVNLDEWLETFSSAIRSIGSVAFIMAPWRLPTPVTRAWCVFEILTTLEVSVERQIIVPDSELTSLKQTILRGDFGTGGRGNEITAVLRDINVMRAKAFKPEDEKAILEKIKQRGILDVNNVVMLPIKTWYLEAVLSCVNEAASDEERANAYDALYAFQELLGRPKEGFEAAEKALECRRKVGNEGKTLSALHQLGTAWSISGDWNKAGECFEECLANETALPSINEAIQIKQQYTSVLIYRNQLDEAVALGFEALKMTRDCFDGKPSVEVADSASTLGALLKSVDRLDEAKALFNEALDMYKQLLGEDHPTISMALANLAVIVKLEGKNDEAIDLYMQAFTITERTMGTDHVELASIYSNIGSAYLSKGDVQKAFENGNKAYVIWLRVLGPEHQMTVMAKQYWETLEVTKEMAGINDDADNENDEDDE